MTLHEQLQQQLF